MTSTSVDVAIVGGGLMGCFSAYYLRQRGRSVAIIEKGKAGAAASGVNFGNLRLQGRHPTEFPLSLRAHAVWEDLSRLTGEDCGFVACGHVYLAFAEDDLLKIERAAGDARAAGLEVDVLDGAKARRRWPVLSNVVKRGCRGRSAMRLPIRPWPRR
ncbi:MAG: FAD-dependent oxidoreductase, partial [Rhodospirillales bacterium]|nr:FAD-dependent oxidoreductase [Rhodospirillales bacterium]